MAEAVRVKNIGLRGVTVADTKISFIDGEEGVLLYRGFRIEDLAEKSSYLETAYLLLNGSLPGKSELESFEEEVTASRELPDFVMKSLREWPGESNPMDVLQGSVPLLAMADPDLADASREAFERMSARLIARLPTLVAAWHRLRNGQEPLHPDRILGHAANFLYMMNGEKPDEESSKEVDTLLILQADHTFNASTFACREVVSTRAHIYAGVAAGLGALSGPLHGGANAEVMRMLLSLENETDIAGWVRDKLDRGEKIMGLGHAIYKTMDPRAKYLKDMAERMAEQTGQKWAEISSQIEEYGVEEFHKRGKSGIRPNLDFYSAPVDYMLGIPIDFMTPVFAVSRVAGWCAHIIEEVFAEAQAKPMLYRPKAEYVGDYCGLTGCEYEEIRDR
ncbi:MAG: citrate/2-methylcitrate synthase [Candidatus Adiutricales bacterium]